MVLRSRPYLKKNKNFSNSQRENKIENSPQMMILVRNSIKYHYRLPSKFIWKLYGRVSFLLSPPTPYMMTKIRKKQIFVISSGTLKNGVNFPKITLTPFEFSNFPWETNKLNFKRFCGIKKFKKILKKSRM